MATVAAIVRLIRSNAVREAQVRQLAHIALVDSLTGLRNRRAFDEEFARALGARERGVMAPRLALAMLDVRGLKHINESLGHQAGDERLVRLAATLRSGVRGSDSVYRLGGDEFMIILPGQGAAEAKRLLERLNASLAADGIDVAAGIAETSSSVSPGALIGRADRALIAAKHGSSRVVVWTPGVDRTSSDPMWTQDDETASQTGG